MIRILKINSFGLFLFLLILFPVSSPAIAESSDTALADIIHKIEVRRGTWIGLQAELNLDFSVDGNPQASCRGELYYQRLDENMMLKGFDPKDNLLFAFKTTDKFFELYLANENAVYRGNIFELESSPDLHSHFKALDFYRALKPMVVPDKNATIETSDERKTVLNVNRVVDGKASLARQIAVNPKGDVFEEKYFLPEGDPEVEIQRSAFKSIPEPGARGQASFPFHIRIQSYETLSLEKKISDTTLSFEKIVFLPSIEESNFEMAIPGDARIVILEEAPAKV